MNNKYSDYILVDFYEDDFKVSDDSKNILYEVLNKLIEKLSNYIDFIDASLSVFIVLTSLHYLYEDINFNLIHITDKKTYQIITFDLSNNITYNKQPYIIYNVENFNSNNYDEEILNFFEWFDYYHKQFFKCINKDNN